VDPKASEPAQRVGEKGDARAHHLDARCPLEDDDVVAGSAQGDRGAEPADAPSDDDHAHPPITLRAGQTIDARGRNCTEPAAAAQGPTES
jgi:hypothetical protein